MNKNPDAIKSRAEAVAAAVVNLEVSRRGNAAAEIKAANELTQKMVDSLITVTTGGIDRGRSGAQFVQTAATAIAGLYTGVLGALFVADHTAPARALIPMIFLGLAIALATFYLAFVMPGKPILRPGFESLPAEDVWIRLNFVTQWVRRVTLPRASALRAAVVSLFFGLLFLPIAIVQVPWSFLQGRPMPEIVGPSSTATTAAASPSPTVIAWPSPTVLPDASLSALLYAAQLEEFRKSLASGSQAAGETPREDWAWVAATLGVLIVVLFWWDPLGLGKPAEAEHGQVVPEGQGRQAQ